MIDDAFLEKPLIEWFKIYGLYGYKDISINFLGQATVVVAENGTGKTTLLNALNAFLSRRFHRLNSINFKRIECKFSDDPAPVGLDRDSIGANETNADLLHSAAQKAGVGADDILDYVLGQYRPDLYQKIKYNAGVAHDLYINTPGDEARDILDSLYKTYTTSLSAVAKDVGLYVQDKLKKSEVIYLPTYRRVEKPLLRPSRRESPVGFLASGSKKGANNYQGISFGLGDIEARLVELSEEIERQSNIGYRYSSARILQDMSKGQGVQLQGEGDHLPDIETLTLFLGRVGPTDSNLQEIITNIKGLYETGAIRGGEFAHLRYFLYRINQVAEQTKFSEQRIEKFVEVCNDYLQMSSDEKKLSFDPATLKVVVKNEWANATVPLDELSSGEKQIVSLMAKLYLYPGNKILLIDEPELSLSIDWQKRVLMDVMKAGEVTQLLAITHSPFIFDNDLDGYTTALNIHRAGS
ncbi:MAG: hypothetical protein EWV73_00005 [Microcystis wesenbergii Mw_QC_B_20070930_S4D]|nr:MAG: hypothetical protein EWV73_00005 [Microcystis wesenbergii Mw_QC_B_20070930_S4D]